MSRFVFLALLLNTGVVSSQGLVDGFFKGKGNVDVALSATFQGSQHFFAGNERIDLDRAILSLSAFAEYGITEKWDVIGNVPVINLQLQDASFYTKYELVSTKIKGKKLSIIPALGFSLPLFNYATETSQAIGQRATVFGGRLVVQQELPKGMFVQVQSGYNYALAPVTSSVPFSIKWGLSFGKNYTDVWFDHQTGFGNKDYLGAVPFTSFRELVVSYHRIGGVFYRQFNQKLGGFVNYSYTINGRNTAQAIGIGTGIVLKF